MDKLVDVTQADRDAAFAVLVRTDDNNGWGREYIRDGMGDDDHAVQAFARHRLASVHALEAELAGVRAALDGILPTKLCGESWRLPDTEKVSIVVTLGKLKAARAILAPTTDNGE